MNSSNYLDEQFLRVMPGYPWLPCPICKGVEGCDHAYPERIRASGVNLIVHPDGRGAER